MPMSPELKQRLQLVMLVAVVISGTRLIYILYQRHESRLQALKQPPPLNADYYVTPKKLYPYDLKSARQLTQQPVWVKVGYGYTYYPYDTARHRVDLSHETGKLLPIEKLQIKDVIISEAAQRSPGERQVMAVFDQEGKAYAFPIGSTKGGEYKFYSDDMLFIQDPHELYNHWPSDVWNAIDQHQVKPGMSELQADFAVGIGIPESSSSESGNRTLNYPNGGNPLSVTYRNDKAVSIKPGPPG
jgi:hypothetical protein